MKDNTNLKRESKRPADPKIIELEPVTIGEAAKEQAGLRLQAFPDGYIFLWTHHPTEKGKFVLFNTANEPVAVTQSAPIADLLCQAVRLLFHAVEAQKQQASENNLPTPDNNLPVRES